MFYTYLSIYLRDFLNLSVTETTLYATLPMIMSVIFQNFVWGPISDKFQRRRTLILLGEILAGIGTITVWGIHSLFTSLILAGYVIIIGLAVIEIFWSMSNIGWSALISDIYPSQERSRIMGILTGIGGIGRIIGITIGGVLYDDGYGFRNGTLFFIAALIMFISTIPMIFTPEGGIDLKLNDGQLEPSKPQKHFNIRLVFIIFIISLAFVNFGRNSVATIYSQYLILDSGFGVDSVMLSFIANTRSIATLIIGFTAGSLSKKFGHSNSFIIGIILAVLALILTGVTTSLGVIFVGSFLFGAAEVIIYAASYAIASDLIPEKIRAKLFGVYNTTFFLSWGLAGTLISGPLIDFLLNVGVNEVNAYQSAFFVGALLTIIGLTVFISLEIWIRRQQKQTGVTLSQN